MRLQFLAQPDFQIGRIIFENLENLPYPQRIVLVSAFSNLQTILRLKALLQRNQEAGSSVRFVLGVDLDGTSIEVLRELLSWNIEAFIVKHRRSGHTFHPKLYLFEWVDRAEIITGSSNITEGGFFGNYESVVKIRYDFPVDHIIYQTALQELSRFINPQGPTVYSLTNEFIDRLTNRGLLPTENEARRTYRPSRKVTARDEQLEPIFGVEDMPLPPPPPPGFIGREIGELRRRRREIREEPVVEEAPPISINVEDAITPMAFYMTLPTLQGENIPGEGRIPLEAIELAPEFWGWPDEYEQSVSPRSGQNRIYWNWRPTWRFWSVENPNDVNVQEVRMYMYENSSDFRFYIRPLVNAGANLGDVVRIRRTSQADAEYECVLARRGTQDYDEWIQFCTQPVRNSTRCFGYA